MNLNAHAEDYSFGSIGYTKHIAKDPHDTAGSSYYSDPEENGTVFSYGFGSREDGIGTEFELSYYSKVSNKIASGTDADVSTLALMSNIYAMPSTGEGSFIIGAGAGLARTTVDTNYSLSGVTFNKENSQFTFGYQFMIGFGIDDIELIYKISNFGEVKGGSGTASNSAAYTSDEFDNIYHSINMKFLF